MLQVAAKAGEESLFNYSQTLWGETESSLLGATNDNSYDANKERPERGALVRQQGEKAAAGQRIRREVASEQESNAADRWQ